MKILIYVFHNNNDGILHEKFVYIKNLITHPSVERDTTVFYLMTTLDISSRYPAVTPT